MRIQFKLWVEENGKVLFGEGRLALLKAVAETGSLAGAARELKMSYRAAWGRLKASEKRLGFTLVERGKEGKRAMQLTDEALNLVNRYVKLETKAEDFAQSAEGDWAKELARLRG